MINYYANLGLNSNGLDNENKPYENKVIKKAHKILALKYHPDKNPENIEEATAKFRQIQEAYESLCNSQKRQELDDWLKENAGTLEPTSDLIIDLDLDSDEWDENSDAIIVKPQTTVNFSQLLENANCSSETIIHLAETVKDFCYATLGNADMLNRLSRSENYELFFILLSYQENDPIRLNENIQKNLDTLIKGLGVRFHHRDSYTQGLTSACFKRKEQASLFFKTYPDILRNLDKSVLFNLSISFEEALEPLLTSYKNTLTLNDICNLAERYPHRHDDFHSVLESFFKRENSFFTPFGLYEFFIRLPHQKELIIKLCQQLGYSYNLLLTQEKTGRELIEYSKQFNATDFKQEFFQRVTQAFDILQFDILYFGEKCAWSSEFDKYFTRLFLEKNQFILHSAQALEQYFDQLSGSFRKKFINLLLELGGKSSYTKFLVEHFWIYPTLVRIILQNSQNSDYDKYCLQSIPDNLSLSLKRQYNAIFLAMTWKETPFLLNLLGEDFIDRYPFFVHNVELCLNFLKNLPNNIQQEEKFLLHLANWVAKNKNQEIDSYFRTTNIFHHSEKLRNFYDAFQYFYQFISQEGQVNRVSVPLTTEAGLIFDSHLTVVGFFPDIVFINTDNTDIQLRILKAIAPNQRRFFRGDYLVKWHKLLPVVCEKASISQLDELLSLYKKYILEKLFCRGDYYVDIFEMLRFLNIVSRQPAWVKKHLSCGFVAGVKSYLNKPDLMYNMAYWGSDTIPFGTEQKKELREKAERIQSSTDVSSKEYVFQQYIKNFRAIKTQYPTALFSNYLNFIDNVLYQARAKVYRELENFVSEFESVDTTYSDQKLMQLFVLLKKSGIDEETIENILNKFPKNSPWRVAFITLLSESHEFHLPSSVLTVLSKNTVLEASIHEVATQSLLLANHLMDKYRKQIHGDLLIKLYTAHGDNIIPKIDIYGLYTQLSLSKKLMRSMNAMQARSTLAFRNTRISSAETEKALFDKLRTLINNTLSQTREWDNKAVREAIEACYAEILFSFSNEEPHPALIAIRDSYASLLEQKISDKDILKVWLFELAWHHPEDFLDSARDLISKNIDAEAETLMSWFKSRKTVSSLEESYRILGEKILLNVIKVCIQKVLPEEKVSDAKVVELYTMLEGEQLFKWRQFLSFDENRLKKIYRYSGYLCSELHKKRPITSEGYLLFTLPETQLPLLPLVEQQLISAEQINALSPFEFSLYECLCQSNEWSKITVRFNALNGYLNSPSFKNLDYFLIQSIQAITEEDMNLIRHNILNVVMESTCDQPENAVFEALQNNQNALSLPVQTNMQKLASVQQLLQEKKISAESINNHPSIVQLNQDKIMFTPLLIHHIVPVEVINSWSTDSLCCSLFLTELEKYNGEQINDTSLKPLHLLKTLSSSEDFKFLEEKIMGGIDNEIQRLNLDNGTEKANQLTQYKQEVRNNICQSILNGCQKEDATEAKIFIDTRCELEKKLNNIMEEPQLKHHRNSIRASLKGLLGVLITTPFAFTPLLSAKYRTYFFKTTTVKNLSNMNNLLINQTRKP